MPPTREVTMLAAAVIRKSCALSCSGTALRSTYITYARTFSTASSDAAQASISGQDAAPGWMGRELKPKAKKDAPLSWLYMREGADGVKRLMPLSERLIWGTVLGGIGLFLGPRIYKARIKAAEEQEAAKIREQELHEKRLTAVRILLSGKNWAHDDAEALEGMAPKQIVEFITKHSINPDDPFEGMSPEEIDEFVRKTGIDL